MRPHGCLNQGQHNHLLQIWTSMPIHGRIFALGISWNAKRAASARASTCMPGWIRKKATSGMDQEILDDYILLYTQPALHLANLIATDWAILANDPSKNRPPKATTWVNLRLMRVGDEQQQDGRLLKKEGSPEWCPYISQSFILEERPNYPRNGIHIDRPCVRSAQSRVCDD